jgi:hypothetical protein
LNRHQPKLAVAFLTGHAPVRGHLRTIGLFNEDPSCRFCRMETETAQHVICSSEALSRQRYNVFGKPMFEPKEISTASVRDLCLFIRVSGLLNLCYAKLKLNSVALVRERTIPPERPPPVDEVSANFCV